MPRFILRLLAACLLLAAGQPATAQLLRQDVYGTRAEEEGGQLLALRGGGYLVYGRQQALNQPGRLYLLRLNAAGDTLWSKRYAISPFDIIYEGLACENNNGQILVSGFGFEDNSPSGTDAILLLLSPQGDSLWSRVTRGPTSDGYTSLLLAPDGHFVATAKLNNSPVWLKINAAGQVLQSTNLTYSPTDIGGLITMQPVATGGYWLIAASDNFNNPKKVIYLNALGARGIEKLLPAGASSIYFLQLLSTGQYGLDFNGRLALYTAQMDSVWSRRLTARGMGVQATLVRETPQGNLLVLGQRTSNQQEDLAFVLVSPQGTTLRDTVLYRGVGLNSNEYGRGLALDPATGNYVFSGYVPNGPIGGADLFVGVFRRFNTVLGTRPAGRPPVQALEAWPNPLGSGQDELHVRAGTTLAGEVQLRDALGRLLRRWPATRAAAEAGGQTLSLAGVPAGLYLLSGTAPGGTRYVARVLRR